MSNLSGRIDRLERNAGNGGGSCTCARPLTGHLLAPGDPEPTEARRCRVCGGELPNRVIIEHRTQPKEGQNDD